ncbi:Do family serine endopeptidase [Porticoccus sp. W117]|uniref:Do family serine endopeptidase n=1 Tax=Porticoccus sp. W117 TaxID=3054777 RepID=UPI002595F904|nr:Do family serine endopeptidase [Porticoccus sp. W117]MDM3869827.1 Do family serine endopeptidase [Porticoccus sp. W117]
MLNKLVKLFFITLVTVSVSASAELPDFTQLIEESSPAVVKIEVEGKAASSSQQEQMEEMLRRFFGQRGAPRQQQPRRSSGSGFVVSDDGYILTNNHVVENGDTITVRFSDREEFTAEIIGTDRETDLALLKIDAKDLPTLEFGDSENLKVGEWVVAIGSPFGLDYSASVGIVSAIGRSLPNDNFVPFIQTDVAINPGNSGGPLFNLNGDVVGINSQIYTRSGGSNGISFSIPSHVATRVIEQLKDSGSVDRGYLGVGIESVTAELAEAFGLKKAQGAIINSVTEGTPAEEAGLEEEDVIVSIDGKKVITDRDVFHIVSNIAPGKEVAVVVMREGKRKSIDVTVGSRAELAGAGGAAGSNLDRLGLAVTAMTADELAQWRIRYGVKVTQVGQDSPAAEADIRAGDVIVKIGRGRVTSVSDYRKLAQAMPEGRGVAFKVYRNGRPGYIVVTL